MRGPRRGKLPRCLALSWFLTLRYRRSRRTAKPARNGKPKTNWSKKMMALRLRLRKLRKKMTSGHKLALKRAIKLAVRQRVKHFPKKLQAVEAEPIGYIKFRKTLLDKLHYMSEICINRLGDFEVRVLTPIKGGPDYFAILRGEVKHSRRSSPAVVRPAQPRTPLRAATSLPSLMTHRTNQSNGDEAQENQQVFAVPNPSRQTIAIVHGHGDQNSAPFNFEQPIERQKTQISDPDLAQMHQIPIPEIRDPLVQGGGLAQHGNSETIGAEEIVVNRHPAPICDSLQQQTNAHNAKLAKKLWDGHKMGSLKNCPPARDVLLAAFPAPPDEMAPYEEVEPLGPITLDLGPEGLTFDFTQTWPAKPPQQQHVEPVEQIQQEFVPVRAISNALEQCLRAPMNPPGLPMPDEPYGPPVPEQPAASEDGGDQPSSSHASASASATQQEGTREATPAVQSEREPSHQPSLASAQRVDSEAFYPPNYLHLPFDTHEEYLEAATFLDASDSMALDDEVDIEMMLERALFDDYVDYQDMEMLRRAGVSTDIADYLFPDDVSEGAQGGPGGGGKSSKPSSKTKTNNEAGEQGGKHKASGKTAHCSKTSNHKNKQKESGDGRSQAGIHGKQRQPLGGQGGQQMQLVGNPMIQGSQLIPQPFEAYPAPTVNPMSQGILHPSQPSGAYNMLQSGNPVGQGIQHPAQPLGLYSTPQPGNPMGQGIQQTMQPIYGAPTTGNPLAQGMQPTGAYSAPNPGNALVQGMQPSVAYGASNPANPLVQGMQPYGAYNAPNPGNPLAQGMQQPGAYSAPHPGNPVGHLIQQATQPTYSAPNPGTPLVQSFQHLTQPTFIAPDPVKQQLEQRFGTQAVNQFYQNLERNQVGPGGQQGYGSHGQQQGQARNAPLAQEQVAQALQRWNYQYPAPQQQGYQHGEQNMAGLGAQAAQTVHSGGFPGQQDHNHSAQRSQYQQADQYGYQVYPQQASRSMPQQDPWAHGNNQHRNNASGGNAMAPRGDAGGSTQTTQVQVQPDTSVLGAGAWADEMRLALDLSLMNYQQANGAANNASQPEHFRFGNAAENTRGAHFPTIASANLGTPRQAGNGGGRVNYQTPAGVQRTNMTTPMAPRRLPVFQNMQSGTGDKYKEEGGQKRDDRQ